MLCLIISAYYNLTKGGVITVSIDVERNSSSIKIIAKSTELNIDQDGLNILSGKGNDDDFNVQNSHEYYTYYLSQKMGYNIYVKQSIETIEYYLENRL